MLTRRREGGRPLALDHETQDFHVPPLAPRERGSQLAGARRCRASLVHPGQELKRARQPRLGKGESRIGAQRPAERLLGPGQGR